MSWQKKEEYVRKVLSERFGVKFKEGDVRLRGTNKTYRFDLVSPNGSIVGEVKTYVSPTKSGKRPSAKIAHASEACLFLMHAEGAKKRLLVFTDKNFYTLYKNERQGQMAKANGIEIMLVNARMRKRK
ncbi:MAG: hypothetical protein QHH17_00945 [Candidatus Bathyarchaeota archaeon]|jgi:hypothetical protein|nr:hypothetical protein [Candidatus Bathyarchaeota archaeon]